mmetsp:Transcript_1450/g.3499  ORF Transcript_1450/g.3499 Transcript_1450/m.3499 type:complete len:284 (+) Transcript_1450:341-1192(+)
MGRSSTRTCSRSWPSTLRRSQTQRAKWRRLRRRAPRKRRRRRRRSVSVTFASVPTSSSMWTSKMRQHQTVWTLLGASAPLRRSMACRCGLGSMSRHSARHTWSTWKTESRAPRTVFACPPTSSTVCWRRSPAMGTAKGMDEADLGPTTRSSTSRCFESSPSTWRRSQGRRTCRATRRCTRPRAALHTSRRSRRGGRVKASSMTTGRSKRSSTGRCFRSWLCTSLPSPTHQCPAHTPTRTWGPWVLCRRRALWLRALQSNQKPEGLRHPFLRKTQSCCASWPCI